MRNNCIYLIIPLILLVGIIPSCVEPVTPPETQYETILVNSNITSATTWTEGNIYVINKSDFYIESELTIEAGVIVKLPSNYAYITLGGSGKILAIGDAQNPIVFTSYKDDSKGGDTNSDEESTSPSRGSWGTIDLNGKDGCVFEYCEFYYGGMGSSPEPTLSLSAGSQANIEYCTFAHNAGGEASGYYYGALDAKDAQNNSIIRGNKFYDNGLPLTLFAEIDTDASNTFYVNGTGNDMNGIFVSGSIGKNTNWQETEVAYVVTGFDMVIYDGYRLLLSDNTTIKFSSGSRFNLTGGVSALENYEGDGVSYTSIKDDSRKGDTNGDGSVTSAAEADWEGIFLDDYKGGYANWPNIYFNNPNATVK